MPESFKNPVLWSGYAVEVSPAGGAAEEPLHWRDATAGQSSGVTVNGVRAEIAWSGGTQPVQADYVLCGATGREFASISVRKGDVVLKASARVRCWYWVAVEPNAVDCAGLQPERAASRFDWQLRKGLAEPGLIRRDDHWLNGRTQRFDLPLDLREGAGDRSASLVFIDRVTGWAMGSEIELVRDASMRN